MMGMLLFISTFTLLTVVEVNARLKDIINRLEKMKKGEQK